jgi:hypothetical protein
VTGPAEEVPYVLSQHGMADLTRRARSADLRENLEVARQCDEGAAMIAARYPIAARLLAEEAKWWRGE